MRSTLTLVMVLLATLLDDRHLKTIDYLRAENQVLRQQLGDKRLTFTNAQRRRLARAARAAGRRLLTHLDTLVTPDTLLRWYRQLVAAKYNGSKRRGPGRPRVDEKIRNLIVDFARDNPTWGYTRIRGALAVLGHSVGRSTIARILADYGIDPVPQRPSKWSDFLRSHLGHVFATDFFDVEVLTMRGLIRYRVLFVIDLESRRVQIAGVAHDPDGAWVKLVLRQLLDAVDGFLLSARYLVMDRDPVFTTDVREMLADAGVQPVRLPAHSPNLNAHAERFVGSVRRELLDRVIPLGERHLRWLLREYVAHYNHDRPHQGIGNRLIDPTIAANGSGPIQRRDRVGGLLRSYARRAA